MFISGMNGSCLFQSGLEWVCGFQILLKHQTSRIPLELSCLSGVCYDSDLFHRNFQIYLAGRICIFDDFLHYIRIEQSGDISKVACFSIGNLSKYSTHDLA